MNDTVILFFALLTVLCQIFVVSFVVLRVGSRFSSTLRNAYRIAADAVAPVAVPFALAVATVTVLGSLFLSEVVGYTPCRLCWYQRLCLYPLVPVLALYTWRRWRPLFQVAMALALIDLPISTYHYVLERFPHLESSTCDPKVPCTLLYVWRFNYISILLMAFTSAATVITLLLLSKRATTTDQRPDN